MSSSSTKYTRRIILTPFYGCWSDKFQRECPYHIPAHEIKKVERVDNDRTMLYCKSTYIARERDVFLKSAYEAILYVKETPEQVWQLVKGI